MLAVRRFFSERKFIFAYLAVWFAVVWAMLAISSLVTMPLFVSNTLYLLIFAVIHLGIIAQLYLLSKGQSPSIKNGFQLAQKYFLDWVLVVIFAILYSLIVILPLALVFIIALVTGIGILVIISLGLAYPLFVLLTLMLYEYGIRAVIFHDLLSNHAVKYAFKLVRENIKTSLKAVLGYFAVLILVVFLIGLLLVIGFTPYASNPDLTVALRLYAENPVLGFGLSLMTFFILGIGLIFSTSLMNTFFMKITDKAVSIEAVN